MSKAYRIGNIAYQPGTANNGWRMVEPALLYPKRDFC